MAKGRKINGVETVAGSESFKESTDKVAEALRVPVEKIRIEILKKLEACLQGHAVTGEWSSVIANDNSSAVLLITKRAKFGPKKPIDSAGYAVRIENPEAVKAKRRVAVSAGSDSFLYFTHEVGEDLRLCIEDLRKRILLSLKVYSQELAVNGDWAWEMEENNNFGILSVAEDLDIGIKAEDFRVMFNSSRHMDHDAVSAELMKIAEGIGSDFDLEAVNEARITYLSQLTPENCPKKEVRTPVVLKIRGLEINSTDPGIGVEEY